MPLRHVCAIISEFLQFQGAQTVGMGAEAQSVPAAAKLFNQANDILGYLQVSHSIYVALFGVFSLAFGVLLQIAWVLAFQENEI